MKQLLAIFLLTLFLVNIIGSKVVYWMVERHEDKQVEELLDNQLYDEAELITLKIPLHLQYQNNTSSYERVDGEISVRGRIYKYVKRKIEEGNLILLCLPDYTKMRLKKVKDDFGKDASNLAQSPTQKKENNSKENSAKSFQSDFFAAELIYKSNIFSAHVNHALAKSATTFASLPRNTPEQPPEL